MRKNQLVTWVVLAAFIVGSPVICGAQSTRVIPKGTLSVVENGKPAGEFKSEMPLPQGSSLVCSGECLVQEEKFQLLAHDKADFSLAKNDKEWVLSVKSGTVEFLMGEDAKLAFVTPKGKYEVTKAIPANGLVRGSVDVTATGTEFATTAGVLYLASVDGVQVIQQGRDAAAEGAGAAGLFGMSAETTTVVIGGVVVGGVVGGLAGAGAFSSGTSSSQ